MIRTLTFSIGLYLTLSIGVSVWIYQNAFQAELAADRIRGDVRLSEATSRLRGQFDVYRALANLVAHDPELDDALTIGVSDDIKLKLSRLKLTYGAWKIDLVDPMGLVIASSDPPRRGRSYSTGLISAALNGRLGQEQAVEDGHRLIRFSRGVRSEAGNIVGGVIISTSLASLEFEWPVSPETILFVDQAGFTFSANRPELLLLSTSEDPESARLPLFLKGGFTAVQLWQFTSDGMVEVQVLSRFVPYLDMTAQILLDTAQARSTAQLRTMLAAALLLVIGLIGTVFMQQRRRLALESQHSATLEARVETRTAELRAAQDELVETSKLAALGRLSAGISHELNQPLAVILNFAENGRRFLEKKRVDKAFGNFVEISNQIRRITRIIGNLRAFARQEVSPSDFVGLSGITSRSLHLMEDDLSEAGIHVTQDLPDVPVPVLAGKVRLEQVVLNLVSNAVDAMQNSEEKVLSVVLSTADGRAQLTVSDTGSGIKEPDRVFEPFYTTKELGSSKGLGMGLALSYGIVKRFGGQLSCRNIQSGAQFTMTLPLAEQTDDT